MKTLSVFVDESGDFGAYQPHSPYYIFTLVFHDQGNSIEHPIDLLEKRLPDFGLPKNHCFHVGPIIRREEDYISFSIKERRKILNSLITFFNNVEISYKTFYVEKNHLDPLKMTALLSKKLFLFLYERAEYFSRFDRIVVYYDNGQVELGKLLATVFAIALPGAEFRRVIPADYRLFQVADLICTMQLTMLKDGRHILLNSEEIFFGSLRDMKKNYLKPILKKQIPD